MTGEGPTLRFGGSHSTKNLSLNPVPSRNQRSRTRPGCANGDFNTIYFYDASGKAENADCSGICAKNTNYQEFTWSTNDAQNQLTLNYGYGETCGESNPYNTTVTVDYSCTNSSLNLNDVTWTRR